MYTHHAASVGRNNQRALRHVHMTCKHNLCVGFFWVSCAVHGLYFSCRNALGLIATYASWGREIARCEIWRGRGPKGDPDRWYRACSDRARDRFTLCIKNGGKPDPNEPDEWSERDLK